jgi:hypothetical protein
MRGKTESTPICPKVARLIGTLAPTPAPGTLALVLGGLVVLGWRARRPN